MKKKAVLVVEDNRVIARIIGYKLECAGYSVRICNDGCAAIEALAAEQFDAIVTDYQMPKMNGEQFCRHARQDVRHADVPIFLLSAKQLELDIEQLTEDLALEQVLAKPFSPLQLVELLHDALVSVSVG